MSEPTKITWGRFDVFDIKPALHLRFILFDYLTRPFTDSVDCDYEEKLDIKTFEKSQGYGGYEFFVRDLPIEIYKMIRSLYTDEGAPYEYTVGGQWVLGRSTNV